MKHALLFASIVVASGLLFANVYNSVVDVPSWGADIPRTIEVAREYFKSVNPGAFFRMFSPLNQVLGLIALILFWRTSNNVRMFLGVALVLYVLGDVMTFAYFFPRNDILFINHLTDTETLRETWTEWKTMNWVRSLVVLVGIVCSLMALHRSYQTK